eukprot:TRINITY_DN10601_c0_g4_i2.p1 TRINITY_DN10601_c0_g4~~TRINITY_DN10601_c0_g4_i2.p1  ORF type:complete len:766 (-),score=161.72 TRINITY_DN10601_c0_g4_i2:187-2484(-)
MDERNKYDKILKKMTDVRKTEKRGLRSETKRPPSPGEKVNRSTSKQAKTSRPLVSPPKDKDQIDAKRREVRIQPKDVRSKKTHERRDSAQLEDLQTDGRPSRGSANKAQIRKEIESSRKERPKLSPVAERTRGTGREMDFLTFTQEGSKLARLREKFQKRIRGGEAETPKKANSSVTGPSGSKQDKRESNGAGGKGPTPQRKQVRDLMQESLRESCMEDTNKYETNQTATTGRTAARNEGQIKDDRDIYGNRVYYVANPLPTIPSVAQSQKEIYDKLMNGSPEVSVQLNGESSQGSNKSQSQRIFEEQMRIVDAEKKRLAELNQILSHNPYGEVPATVQAPPNQEFIRINEYGYIHPESFRDRNQYSTQPENTFRVQESRTTEVPGDSRYQDSNFGSTQKQDNSGYKNGGPYVPRQVDPKQIARDISVSQTFTGAERQTNYINISISPIKERLSVDEQNGALAQRKNGVVPAQLQEGTPTQWQNGVPAQLQEGTPTQWQNGVPGQLQAGIPVQLQDGTPTQWQNGFPGQLQKGAPAQWQTGIPTQLQKSAPPQWQHNLSASQNNRNATQQLFSMNVSPRHPQATSFRKQTLPTQRSFAAPPKVGYIQLHQVPPLLAPRAYSRNNTPSRFGSVLRSPSYSPSRGISPEPKVLITPSQINLTGYGLASTSPLSSPVRRTNVSVDCTSRSNYSQLGHSCHPVIQGCCDVSIGGCNCYDITRYSVHRDGSVCRNPKLCSEIEHSPHDIVKPSDGSRHIVITMPTRSTFR